ncbi:LmeA family phospholipid-binding protein [Nocardia camponoti]|uniref:DUF2993 domain-containing protein n=1 Tax=Nocardia camponoti TaxID=1616106 RepID=A0A917V8R3_9NOCA|nr:DUF2993 domain-containing protein [Nocardia camponoti]GGK50949.1 hypothetical protein GCM10011591_23110 [Nocardia camponoti]
MSTQTTSDPKISRRTLLIALGVVAALLVAAVVGTEAYARHKISSCISNGFEQSMGSRIDVSFGPKPMLLSYVDGKVSSMTIDSEDNKFGPAIGMNVHAQFNDVEMKNRGADGATIGSSTATVTWNNAGIQQTLTGMVSGVKSSASTGLLTLDVLGGLAQLEVQPKVVNGTVEIETKSAQFLGLGLPTDLVQSIVDTFTTSFQSYPLGLKPTSIKVTDDGLKVDLAGGHTDLPAGQNLSGNQQIKC